MLRRLEDLQKPDNVLVPHFLEQVHLLEHLALLVLVLHQRFVDCLNSHLLPSKLVDAKCHFAEGSLPDELEELVVVQAGLRRFESLQSVSPDVVDELISVLSEAVVVDERVSYFALRLEGLSILRGLLGLDEIGGGSAVA